MQVILMKEVESLGQAGETVKVKNGYARNYLIPQGLAMIATKSNLALIENKLKTVELKEAKSRENLESLANELNKIKLNYSLKAGEDEKLFGSVTSQMISDSCKELGFKSIIDGYGIAPYNENGLIFFPQLTLKLYFYK